MMIQIDTQKSELYFLIKYLPPRFDHYTGTSTGSFLSMVSLKLWLSCKESACNAGDLGSIPSLGKHPGERKGYPSSILVCRYFLMLKCILKLLLTTKFLIFPILFVSRFTIIFIWMLIHLLSSVIKMKQIAKSASVFLCLEQNFFKNPFKFCFNIRSVIGNYVNTQTFLMLFHSQLLAKNIWKRILFLQSLQNFKP